MKFSELLDKLEVYVLKRTKATYRDGIDDPCGDEVIIDPWLRGGLLKARDGKLYTPRVAGGFNREKNRTEVLKNPQNTTTNGAVVVALASGIADVVNTPTAYGVNSIKYKVISAYQSSGGALTVRFWMDAGGTQLIYSESIPDSTITPLRNMWPLDFGYGTLFVSWTGAAGATQYILGYTIDSVPIVNTGPF